MKVVAKRMGYYGLKRIREGQVFDLQPGHKLGEWMKKVGESDAQAEVEAEESAAKPKGKAKKVEPESDSAESEII